MSEAFGKRKVSPTEQPSAASSNEVAPRGSKRTPEDLIALAEKWQDREPGVADTLRHLAGLLSFQGTNDRVRDDARIIDNLFKLANSQLEKVGDSSIRQEDF